MRDGAGGFLPGEKFLPRMKRFVEFQADVDQLALAAHLDNCWKALVVLDA
jgi:hypothetical protein